MVLTVGFPACLGPVAPDDGDGLEEGDKHQGDGGRVVVHQLEEVDPTLRMQRDVYYYYYYYYYYYFYYYYYYY
jgi:hypothetical protein